MRLKYYLRGAGIGILFATLVMTVSAFVHKYNITDEYIIKEARKLGMVMKDELKDNNNGFWDSDDIVEESERTEEGTQVVGSETKPSESQKPSETPKPSESQKPSETPKPSESQKPSETPKPSESEKPSQAPSESESPSEEVEYVTVVIASGDYARQVAAKVRDAGLVEDAEEFRKYIGSRGYDKIMRPGSYKIPVGSTYEEICLILIRRSN